MKRKILMLVCLILFLLTGVLIIRGLVDSSEFRNLRKDISTEFDYVQRMTLSNYGPHCTIDVYLDSDDYDFEKVEKVFIEVMLKVNEPSLRKYLIDIHDKRGSGELAFLHISFREKGNDSDVLYKFNNYRDFRQWELESNLKKGQSSKQYMYSDYE
jgi:hypothetical protein